MNEKLENIFGFIICAIIAYLIISFLSLDLNPLKWGFLGRFIFVLSVLCFTTMIKFYK